MTEEEFQSDWDEALAENWEHRLAGYRAARDRVVAGLQWYLTDSEWARRAAVPLLIDGVKGKWVNDGGFVSTCVHFDRLDNASIDWQKAAAFAHSDGIASSGERDLLKIACSLAGAVPANLNGAEETSEWSIRSMIQSLDEIECRRVLAAMKMAMTGRY